MGESNCGGQRGLRQTGQALLVECQDSLVRPPGAEADTVFSALTRLGPNQPRGTDNFIEIHLLLYKERDSIHFAAWSAEAIQMSTRTAKSGE